MPPNIYNATHARMGILRTKQATPLAARAPDAFLCWSSHLPVASLALKSAVPCCALPSGNRGSAGAEGITQLTVVTADAARERVRAGFRDGSFSVPPLPQSVTKLIGRVEACQKMSDYIKAVHAKANKGKDKKFPLLGCSGMKGIGKSALLEYGAQVTVPALTTLPLPWVAASIYVAFNGGGVNMQEYLTSLPPHQYANEHCANAFGRMLMISSGVDRVLAQKLVLDDCLTFIRESLALPENGTLCVFVDEVGALGDKFAGDLLSALMSHADVKDGKLACVFSHIREHVLQAQETESGRKVDPLPLPSLPIASWRDVTHAVAAARQSPGLHQLLLACGGHPRALIDGIPAALKEVPNLFTAPTEHALIVAKKAIMDECKFNELVGRLDKIVPKWFNIIAPLSATELARDGLLLTIVGEPAAGKPNVELLHPLILQSWAQQQCNNSPLAFHLQQAYAADSMVGHGVEKKMEAIMYNYEAVLRTAVGDQEFPLKRFYRSEHIGARFRERTVHAKVPKGSRLVEFVDDFDDMSEVVHLLNQGFIVVSRAHNEVGVEYLSAYTDVETHGLIVAATQCKFVEKQVAWKDIKSKMKVATEYFHREKIGHFPVIYTTVDQKTMLTATYENGVYFNESDIFDFTNKLGVMRLHCEKLGRHLQNKYPWLQHAASMPDEDTR